MVDRSLHSSEDLELGAADAATAKSQRDRLTKFAGTGLALVSLLVLWTLLSIYVRPWVPTPLATLREMQTELGSEEFYRDLWLTFQRVLAAFLASTVIGSILGIAVGLSKRVEAFFSPLLALALSIPDPVIIIFSILALGPGELTGFVALTIALSPFVANIVRTSVHARDPSLDEMMRVYRIPPHKAFWANLIPQLVPALVTAARLSFALSWKIVILVEALARPDGIGAAIFHAFNVLRMREVVALSILFTVLMQLIERGGLGPLERRLLRWRD